MRLKHFLNLGVDLVEGTQLKQRVLFLNYFNVVSFCVMIVMLVIESFTGYHTSTLFLIPALCFVIVSSWFNYKGDNNKAFIVINYGLLVLLNLVLVFDSTRKLPLAPICCLLIAFSSVPLIKPSFYKNVLIVSAVISYLWMSYFQMTIVQFLFVDYLFQIPLVLVSVWLFIKMTNVFNRFNNEIQLKNVELEANNKLIQSLKEKEIKLEVEKRELLKNSLSLGVETTKNITKQLAEVLKQDSSIVKTEIRKVIAVLNEQESQEFSSNTNTFKSSSFSESEFTRALLNKHPNLTKSELRLCICLRLGMSVKEITQILNVSENSIYVKRSRLKNKMLVDDLFRELMNI